MSKTKIEWYSCKEKMPPRLASCPEEFSIDVILYKCMNGEDLYSTGYFEIYECAIPDEENPEPISDKAILKHGWGEWHIDGDPYWEPTHWTFLPEGPEADDK